MQSGAADSKTAILNYDTLEQKVLMTALGLPPWTGRPIANWFFIAADWKLIMAVRESSNVFWVVSDEAV
jgi:hypothetical protein